MTEVHCDIESFCKYYPSYDDEHGNPCSMKHSCICSAKSEAVLDAFDEINNRLQMADGEGESETGQPLIRLTQAMKIVDDIKTELRQAKERE